MEGSPLPYSVPDGLEPALARVLAYWEGLKRGEADMPFWDDVVLSALPDLAGRLMLAEVFERPQRLRFGIVGDEIKRRYGGDIAGKFLDDIEIHHPLEFLRSQSSATIESRAPTFYRYGLRNDAEARASEPYSRLLLPMWGDGHVGMLLGAVAWG